MNSNDPGELLSFQDYVFLGLERPHMPLHIGAVEMFDGDISIDPLCKFIESKLDEVPRYTQKVEISPLKLAHPRWAPDVNFDIRRHIRRVRLETGKLAELQRLVGRVFSEVMDRRRPLWDMTIVEGFEGGQTPLIWRFHHCLADGIAAVSSMKILMDSKPESHIRTKLRFRPAKVQAPPRQLLETALTSCFEFAQGLVSVASAGLHLAAGITAGGTLQSLGAWGELLPSLLTRIQPLPFNVPCAGARNFVWTHMSLKQIESIRSAAGGTINDVVLAILTSALRRYTVAHRQDIHRSIRIMVPVNTRRPEHMARSGVDISLIPVDLPLDVTDPLTLLRSVESTTRLLKGAHMGRAFSLLSASLSLLPGPAKPFAGWLLSNPLPVLPWNVIATNVPGPVEPLYLLGRKMVACYPYLPVIPLGTDAGLSCAFYSYDGVLYCGFAADIAAMPDVHRFLHLFERAYDELERAARGAAEPAPPARAGQEVQETRQGPKRQHARADAAGQTVRWIAIDEIDE